MHAWRSSLLFGSVVCVLIPAAGGGESVTVQLHSGKSTTAEIDARTNDQLLWLRTAEESILFRRSIPWSEVQGAVHGDRRLSREELRQAAETLKTDLTPADVERPPVAPDHSPGTGGGPPPRPGVVQSWPPLRALAIDARLANFNSTVEADGIAIEIRPLDGFGRITAVRGTLLVEVYGNRLGPADYPAAFPKVASSVFAVETAHFGPEGAAFLVPYHRPHPEFDTDLTPKGLVHARLNVPGAGSFEATTEVRLRPASVTRDRAQLLGYPRFFPWEARGW
jgi:hypothetical protein